MKRCKHFWLIDPPDGETSQGYCKFCGKTNTFLNSLPSKSFTTDAHIAYSNREIFIGKRETLYQTVWG